LKSPAALQLLAAVLALYLVAPFLAGVGQLGLADWRSADTAGIVQAGLVSVLSASLATLLVALGGIPLGFMLARRPGRAMSLLGFVVQLPLAMPPLASGILLLFLLGYTSPLGRLTGGALTDSFAGIVLAEAFVAAPFLIVAARSAFAAIDPVLEDVAATMGHRPGAVFRRVSLALAWRGIAAGLLLTWLRAFGEFGATVMVAYHPYSLPVFTYIAFGSEGLPAMLPILLPTIVIAVLVMALSQRAERRPKLGRPSPNAQPALPLPAIAPTAATPAQPLSFAFARQLDGFSLDVAWHTNARRLAILGASGSGKSATLRLIAGLDQANQKTLTLGGETLANRPAWARGIAYVPQNYGLLPNLPVERQIRFGVDADPAQAQRWTQRLGLAGLEHRRPAELSLGQQQRVALARALARSSRLLLLDEPFSALDAPLRSRLRAELHALQSEIDTTTILVTHDPAEAMQLADELLLLDRGRVVQAGPVDVVFLRPASETAALLLGAQNLSNGVAINARQIDIGGVLLHVSGTPLPIGPVGWAIHPASIRIVDHAVYPAQVLQAEQPRAGHRLVRIRVGNAMLQTMTDTTRDIDPGPCRVDIDPGALQVWPLFTAPPTPLQTAPKHAEAAQAQ
jgi:molybdate transport system permease protein